MNFKEELAAKEENTAAAKKNDGIKIDNKHVHRGHDQDTGSKSSESG